MNDAATLMANGEVLVAGGTYEPDSAENSEWDSLRNTESYDPATNRWSVRAPTLLPRAQDTATLMPGGDVLIAGGYACGGGKGCLGYGGSGDCCGASSAEVYDPSSNTWQYTDPVLSGNEHTATLLPDGGVLVVGGNIGPTSEYEQSSAEVFAPTSEPIAAPAAKTAVLEPPSITGLAETHKHWREGGAAARISVGGAGARSETSVRKDPARRAREAPLGTTFTFALNEQATVTFAFAKRLAGREVKGKCVAAGRGGGHARRCERSVVRGTITFSGRAGKNRVGFQGRVSRAVKLAPGDYTLLVSATNAQGLRSVGRTLRFTVVGGR